MARTVRESKLDSRAARLKLPASKRFWRAIEPGLLHIGYRRDNAGGGRWIMRRYLGDQTYMLETIGKADDTMDADGQVILSFAQAQKRARDLYGKRKEAPKGGPLTVRQACADYVAYLKAEKKTGAEAEGRLAKHFLPHLGDKLVAELTGKEIDAAKWAMVTSNTPDDDDAERRSKDSANRVLSMFKAALNRAFAEESNHIPTDSAWRRVKPFEGVSRSRQVHLDEAQCTRLINAAQGAFRNLVIAALLTGARPPHELASLRVRHLSDGSLHIPPGGKTGERHVILTAEAIEFFAGLALGKSPDDLLLPKDDGTPWQGHEHTEPMREAAKRAKLPEDTTLYSLRHTHASTALKNGANQQILAENMGTSIRMLERHYAKFLKGTRRGIIEATSLKLGLEPAGNVRPMRGGR